MGTYMDTSLMFGRVSCRLSCTVFLEVFEAFGYIIELFLSERCDTCLSDDIAYDGT